ncbi:MAG TPA: serine hydrolase domain-containing protein, partial [Blastocatellia bacterium]
MATIVVFSAICPTVLSAMGRTQPARQQTPATNGGSKLQPGAPESVGMSSTGLDHIAPAVESAIKKAEVPGAVVLVARNGRIVYRKAFGNKDVEPRPEPMTIDTVFDLASLTKIVATATSMMILVERGQLSLADPVALYIPEFGRFGKEHITIEQLLTHRAGLPPDNDIADYVGVTANPLKSICDLKPMYEPGSTFVYSDVGYIVAAEIIRRVSGQPVNEFAQANIYNSLGMKDTRFLPIKKDSDAGSADGQESEASSNRGGDGPSREYLDRIAATQNREGRSMRGEVHDPRSYELGGVAGHAGLFSTAGDLAIFCQMILDGGQYNGVRVLAPYSVKRMTSSIALPGMEMRGIGWDINT